MNQDTGWRLWIDNVELTSGQKFNLGSAVTIVVGPNNSGKSTFLRELAHFQPPELRVERQQGPIVVQDAHTETDGDPSRFIAWCARRPNSRNHFKTRRRDHRNVYSLDIHNTELQVIAQTFDAELLEIVPSDNLVTMLDAYNRLSLVHHAMAIDSFSPESRLHQPVHFLYEDAQLENSWKESIRRAFGVPVSIWRDAGSQIPLVVGESSTTPADRHIYQSEMKMLPQLQYQGHGLASYAGIMLSLIAEDTPITLIDEPEAFLHPPQIRMIGRELGRLGTSGRQIIVATHSTDVVKGVIASGHTTGVSILRLTRDQRGNHVQAVSTEALKILTTDTLLRHSNVLDGLFYDGVVLTESDTDATYYSSISDVGSNETGSQQVRGDFLYTHTNGGYNRMHIAVRALRSAGVACACIVDMDFLANDHGLRTLLLAFGTTADAIGIAAELSQLRNDIEQSFMPPKRNEVELRSGQGSHLSREELRRLAEIAQAKSGWAVIKRTGGAELKPSPYTRLQLIMNKLGTIGVFVVPVGEMERFHKHVQHQAKSEWIANVLAEGHFAKEGDHHAFVRSVESFLHHASLGGAEAGIEREP
jgi:predicted ATPase